MTSAIFSLEGANIVRDSKYILNNVSFKVYEKQLISIIGKNGAGKSTLCKVLSDNIKLSSGKIYKKKNLSVSYIPQMQNIYAAIPISVNNFLSLCSNEKSIISKDELLDTFSLRKYLHYNLNKISGGTFQKIVLVRAILKNPDLLIIDEGLSNMDSTTMSKIHSILLRLLEKSNMSIIMVSHNIDLVIKNTAWAICIHHGKIDCQGSIKHINKSSSILQDIFGSSWDRYYHEHN